jgi:hypothetical protein
MQTSPRPSLPLFNTALPTPIRCQELRHQFSPICSPASRSSQLYIVLHSDFHEDSISQIRRLLSTFRSNRDYFCTQNFNSPIGF